MRHVLRCLAVVAASLAGVALAQHPEATTQPVTMPGAVTGESLPPAAPAAAGRTLPTRWVLRLQDPYATYLYHVVLEPAGPGRWRMAETLANTNHPFHRTRIGQTVRDCVLSVQGGTATRTCEGVDPDPATPGRYRSDYSGALQGDVIRGAGRHSGALAHGASWEMKPE